MASFSVSGFEDITKMLESIGEMDRGNLEEKMIEAGAEETKGIWKEEITARGFIKSGEMINHIEADEKIKGKADTSYKDVYPTGTVTRGKKRPIETRNAEKAYVLHYGTGGGTGRIYGSRFVDAIRKKAEDRNYYAMKKIMDDYIDKQ